MIADAPPTGLTDTMKAPYLESKLGAKALLTKKIGGGANSRVYALATVDLKQNLMDAQAYFYDEVSKSGLPKGEIRKRRQEIDTAMQDIVESLASIVEFDGFDTLIDPSPRSSMTLSSYNSSKGSFVTRMLLERTVPSCDAFVNLFGAGRRQICDQYMQMKYYDELPKRPTPATSDLVA